MTEALTVIQFAIEEHIFLLIIHSIGVRIDNEKTSPAKKRSYYFKLESIL